MKEIKKQLICCDVPKCPFGLKKIDEQCNLCRNNKILLITAEAEPILINYEEEVVYGCYQNPKLPLHQKCIFNKKKPSAECKGCVRMTRKVVNSKTEVIK